MAQTAPRARAGRTGDRAPGAALRAQRAEPGRHGALPAGAPGSARATGARLRPAHEVAALAGAPWGACVDIDAKGAVWRANARTEGAARALRAYVAAAGPLDARGAKSADAVLVLGAVQSLHRSEGGPEAVSEAVLRQAVLEEQRRVNAPLRGWGAPGAALGREGVVSAMHAAALEGGSPSAGRLPVECGPCGPWLALGAERALPAAVDGTYRHAYLARASAVVRRVALDAEPVSLVLRAHAQLRAGSRAGWHEDRSRAERVYVETVTGTRAGAENEGLVAVPGGCALWWRWPVRAPAEPWTDWVTGRTGERAEWASLRGSAPSAAALASFGVEHAPQGAAVGDGPHRTRALRATSRALSAAARALGEAMFHAAKTGLVEGAAHAGTCGAPRRLASTPR